MLGKEQIRAVFSFGFKLGRKAAETTRNINNTLGTGTANERAVQWWFKKFCKGDESLEVEERSGWPSEVDSDQLRWSFKILLQLHDKLLQKSVSTILWSFSIWSRLERWKSSVSGCILSWPQKKKKKSSFWSVILFYSTQQWTIFDQISTKSGFYTSFDSDQINGWTEKLQSTSQSQTCTRKRS